MAQTKSLLGHNPLAQLELASHNPLLTCHVSALTVRGEISEGFIQAGAGRAGPGTRADDGEQALWAQGQDGSGTSWGADWCFTAT